MMKRSDSWLWLIPLALAIGCGNDDSVNASASLSGTDSDAPTTGTDSGGTASMTNGMMSGTQTDGSETGADTDSTTGMQSDTDSNSQSGTGDTEGATGTESDSDSEATGTTGGIEPPEIPTDPPGEETGPCEPGELRACYTGNPQTYLVGLCYPGIQECVAIDLDYGEWGPCEDEQLPTNDVCDGFDNDCDGMVDEDLGSTNCGLGLCNHDEPNCVDGLLNECDPDLGAMFEVCDGIDNDCDGDIDEGLGEEVVECGLGQCEHTVTDCEGTTPECNPFEGATTEQCDGIDNDCDGDTDEEIDDITCGLGECEHTIPGCIGGVPQMCDPFEGQSVEICDGLDNDCDGLTDEDQGEWQCGDLECTVTVPQCIDGVPQPESSCVPEPGGEEICGNGQDDNCDGEDPPCAETYLVGTDTTSRPIDVVWMIDSSGSMQGEIDTVLAELNDFADALDAAGGSNALHLIADRGADAFEMCVQPPLGGANCADNPPRFYQYDTNGGNTISMVHSSNALGRAIQQRSTWAPRLQANSHIAFIVTSDDDGDDPAWIAPNDDSETDDCTSTNLITNATFQNYCRFDDGTDTYTSLAFDLLPRLGFISFMQNYFPTHVAGDDWTFYSIVGDTGTAVLSGGDDAFEFDCGAQSVETSDEYVKLSLYTNVQDQMIPICNMNWNLAGLASAIASNVPSDTYVLDGTPPGNCAAINPATISVVVNGIPMNAADWSYDAPSCTVTINNNVPTVGDNVVVVYDNF
jgi:hypothetical protein